jgi:hypothetical protein
MEKTNKMEMVIPAISFNNWKEFLSFIAEFSEESGWIFRGQSKYAPPKELMTSLDRASEFLQHDPIDLEHRVFREFQRRAKFHADFQLPPENEILQWLSLMQHHGCPTRLLDFTYSFYVALFFAVSQPSAESEVWCVKIGSLSSSESLIYNSRTLLSDIPKPVKERPSLSLPKCGTFVEEPHFLNRRLALQQGCFLIPYNIRQPLLNNLISNKIGLSNPDQKFDIPSMFWKQSNIFKVMIPKSLHSEIRKHLRKMNLTSEHLFPGIDGLAKSFWQECN